MKTTLYAAILYAFFTTPSHGGCYKIGENLFQKEIVEETQFHKLEINIFSESDICNGIHKEDGFALLQLNEKTKNNKSHFLISLSPDISKIYNLKDDCKIEYFDEEILSKNCIYKFEETDKTIKLFSDINGK